MTKKEAIETIEMILSEHPEKEVCVAKYQNELRNGRWGMHAYTLCWRYDKLVCRPWSGANCYWGARLERLKKDNVLDILGRCITATRV